MSLGAEYSTLEDYLESERSLRSPTLQRSALNFDSLSTPPPLVDAPDDYEPVNIDSINPGSHTSLRSRHKGKAQPSEYDSLLIKGLGPDYPTEIAERAGTELPIDNPESPCEDRPLDSANELFSMITGEFPPGVSWTYQQHKDIQVLTASEKLNNALNSSSSNKLPLMQPFAHHNYASVSADPTSDRQGPKPEVKVSIASITNDESEETLHVSHLSIQTSTTDKRIDAVQHSKPVLSTLNVTNLSHSRQCQRHDPITNSPTLAKFTITPAYGHPSQTLPRLHGPQSSASPSGQTPDAIQRLPSLETALTSATDSNGTPYIDASPSLTRPSPSQSSPYAMSPGAYAQSTPTVTMSPPRFSSNPASWRTLSNNSSNSAASEYVSGSGSGNGSTPATKPSPSQSVSTPQSLEHESSSDPDMLASIHDAGLDTDLHAHLLSHHGYQCTFPGCTAPPFQTQYLLNSHTNVHSNQRPHFCPVDDCPRGPGGQGFKRKNEMIRHGLVHQSPGYVCPFCPDQQHKYPRPDNLQRHVRVHHMDRDKDDPLLRDVLAQRPEGGNRGRRRRIV